MPERGSRAPGAAFDARAGGGQDRLCGEEELPSAAGRIGRIRCIMPARRRRRDDLHHARRRVSRDRRPERRLPRAGRAARARRPRGGPRRTPHGRRGAPRHRHEQPHRVGAAPRIRDIPDRGRIRRAQRGIGRVGVRADRVRAAGAAVGGARDRVAGRRARGARPRSGAPGPARGGHDPLQLLVDLRLERPAVHGLHGRRHGLPVDADGAPDAPLRAPRGHRRAGVAHRAHHRHRLHLRLSRGAAGLRRGDHGAVVRGDVALPRTCRVPPGAAVHGNGNRASSRWRPARPARAPSGALHLGGALLRARPAPDEPLRGRARTGRALPSHRRRRVSGGLLGRADPRGIGAAARHPVVATPGLARPDRSRGGAGGGGRIEPALRHRHRRPGGPAGHLPRQGGHRRSHSSTANRRSTSRVRPSCSSVSVAWRSPDWYS